jgi:AcrR family transcriptional regulator
MRVTAEVQLATRKRILEVAQHLFTSKGFDATTTRDIAKAAGIATGTMFNYFPSKEAVVGSLAAEALENVSTDFTGSKREGSSLEEDLFSFVAAGLRKLKPLRKHLPVVLVKALSPVATVIDDDSCCLRVSHLETVAQLGQQHGFKELPPLALQIYWSLYVGLLLFWANDTSPRQEDTLALLDNSLEMFVKWLDDAVSKSLERKELKYANHS